MSYFYFSARTPLTRMARYVPDIPEAAQRAFATHPQARLGLACNDQVDLHPDVWQALYHPLPAESVAGSLLGRPLRDDQLDWVLANERRVHPLAQAVRANAANEAWVRRCFTGPGGPVLAANMDITNIAKRGGWEADAQLVRDWHFTAGGPKLLSWLLDHHGELTDDELVDALTGKAARLRDSRPVHTLAAQLLWVRPSVIPALAQHRECSDALAITLAASPLCTDGSAQAALAARDHPDVSYALSLNPVTTAATLRTLSAAGAAVATTRLAVNQTAAARTLHDTPPGMDLTTATVGIDAAIEVARLPRGGRWRGWVPANYYGLALLATNPNLTPEQIRAVATALNGQRPLGLMTREQRDAIRVDLEATHPKDPAAKAAGRAARTTRKPKPVRQHYWYGSGQKPARTKVKPHRPRVLCAVDTEHLATAWRDAEASLEVMEESLWLLQRPLTDDGWSAVMVMLHDAEGDEDLVAMFTAAASFT